MQLTTPSMLERIAAAQDALKSEGKTMLANFLGEVSEALAADWPIARVDVADGKVLKCELYAPALPDGTFELYPAPEVASNADLSSVRIGDLLARLTPAAAVREAYKMGRADAAPSANEHFSKLHAARFDDASANLVGLLLWSLWHHQGASSPVGQPIRRALKLDEHEHLTPEQVATARATVRAFGFDPEY